MNWIFKISESFRFENDRVNPVVTIEQKRIFRGKEGEDVLILEKRNKEWEFTAHYKIFNINIKNSEAEYKLITITLELVKNLEDDKLLEDYIYSFRRISNYKTPIRHFNRKYSRLYDAEFDAIVEDKIYLKRTIVGTVLNAMHRDHQESFIFYVASESPDLLTGNADMEEILRILLDYLNFSIVKPALYLRESSEILKSFLSAKEFAEIGFGPAEKMTARNTQLINPQLQIIDEYLNMLPSSFNQKMGIELLHLEDNPKFKKLFKNSPIPIRLN